MSTIRIAPFVLLAAFACPALAADPPASSLRLELAEIAKDVKDLLNGKKETSVAVGAFTGPSHLDSSAGPGIAKVLTEELEKLGVTVSKKATLEIKGDYLDVIDKKTKLLAARLRARVLDRNGTVIVETERGVFGDATLPVLFGLTTEQHPKDLPEGRDGELKKSIDKPAIHIAKARVAPKPDSPFAVEILVAPRPGEKYEPRPAESKDGLAFVPIKRGEVYAVRLINDADHEVGVSLHIDGLSFFAFSTDRDEKTKQPRFSHVYVAPKTALVIEGWFISLKETNLFEVTEYAKSAAAELKSTEGVGTITAVFAASWPKDGKPPADEPKSAVARARSADATGRGPPIGKEYEEVQRETGVIRAAISVRYTK